MDGKLCLWDSNSRGEVHGPIKVLISKSNYPIYTVDVTENIEYEGNEKVYARIAVGGGRESGFLGIPAYLYDIVDADEAY